MSSQSWKFLFYIIKLNTHLSLWLLETFFFSLIDCWVNFSVYRNTSCLAIIPRSAASGNPSVCGKLQLCSDNKLCENPDRSVSEPSVCVRPSNGDGNALDLLLQDSVWLICCWVCVCASGFVDFGFQFWNFEILDLGWCSWYSCLRYF